MKLVVDEIGELVALDVLVDNDPKYKSAHKLSMETNICIGSPCVAHYIGLMPRDISKIMKYNQPLFDPKD